jgi:hypothetical protein
MREDADVIGRPELPSFSPQARRFCAGHQPLRTGSKRLLEFPNLQALKRHESRDTGAAPRCRPGRVGAGVQLGGPKHAPGAPSGRLPRPGCRGSAERFAHGRGACSATLNGPANASGSRHGRRHADRRHDRAGGDLSFVGDVADVGNEWAMEHPDTSASARRPDEANRGLSRRKVNQPQASASAAVHS